MEYIINNDVVEIIFNKRVYSTEKIFPEFIKIFDKCKTFKNVLFKFDFSHCDIFAGNLCALIGGISYYFDKNGNKLIFVFDTRKKSFIELSENGFLKQFEVETINKDQVIKDYQDHIPYKEFKNIEIDIFDTYIDRDFLAHKDAPKLEGQLRADISESLLEIFNNACDHSHRETPIFTCGKSYPGRQRPRMYFTIVDMGIGFAENFSNKFNLKYNGMEALKEAIIHGKTTKDHPGSLGYKIIKKFIKANQGKLQVFSNNGYYSLSPYGETVNLMESYFEGTIVNLDITIDHSVYKYFKQ